MKLELRGITKRFGSLVANDHIDLVVEPGEIHCLLGENGAGKSTLMNVLYGLYAPDEGEILVDGVVTNFHGPGDAMAAGIGMVHQHFMLIPVFSVAENIMLGHEDTRGPGGFGWLDRRAAKRKVADVSKRFGLAVPPDALVADLPVGVQQRAEILKALARDAKVLVLDEPTAVLTPSEIDDLITVMRKLRDAGTSIVFISHKLKEVKAIGDTITVIRRGRVVGQPAVSSSEQELASLMVGRPVLVDRREGACATRSGGAGRRGVARRRRRGRRPGRRRVVLCARGRDLRHRGCAGQRADRGHRVPCRPRNSDGRPHQRAWQRHHDVVRARPARPRASATCRRIARTTGW